MFSKVQFNFVIVNACVPIAFDFVWSSISFLFAIKKYLLFWNVIDIMEADNAFSFDDSSSDSSDDEELAELMVVNMIHNYSNKYLYKEKVRTLSWAP
ncbi:hypothetical protein RIF29_24783 [Crotalaria pallida]|uniref:Uncharacterized protein n=1 Tax=Crotalaria pallida TaxID=3830 RepID=A0AAN9EL30_CROPI